jgi:hypothetical protein
MVAQELMEEGLGYDKKLIVLLQGEISGVVNIAQHPAPGYVHPPSPHLVMTLKLKTN